MSKSVKDQNKVEVATKMYDGKVKRIMVPEKVGMELNRMTDNYRHKMAKHGRCYCPRNAMPFCISDCQCCNYYREGDMGFYQKDVSESNPDYLIDVLGSTSSSEYLVDDADEFKRIVDDIEATMSEAIKIGKLRLEGKSMVAISKELNIPRTTIESKLDSLADYINKKFNTNFRQHRKLKSNKG